MPESWYESVAPEVALTQGDLIVDCPVVAWQASAPRVGIGAEGEELVQLREILKLDVVVMTQACDIEQGKVDEIVVCPIYTLEEFKTAWQIEMQAKAQNPSDKAWRNYCQDIQGGFLWNYSMLNSGDVAGVTTTHRIVDFHDIYTLPLKFLQGVAGQRGNRLRLKPPYREHLSQAFARYFMRVGLPTSVNVVW